MIKTEYHPLDDLIAGFLSISNRKLMPLLDVIKRQEADAILPVVANCTSTNRRDDSKYGHLNHSFAHVAGKKSETPDFSEDFHRAICGLTDHLKKRT